MAKVLIVVENPELRPLIRDMIGQCGVKVIGEAGGTEDAARLFAEMKPDIVVIGVFDPEGINSEMLRMLKNLDNNARIIIMSQSKRESFLQTAIKEGVSALIIKHYRKFPNDCR